MGSHLSLQAHQPQGRKTVSEQEAGLTSLPLRAVPLLPSRGVGKEQECQSFPLGMEWVCGSQAGARACSPDPALPALLQLEHHWPAWKRASEAQAAALGTVPLLV